MMFSWLFCFFPPLEYGTNWSECQWPACQPVFWLCIFPELATLSRQKKKKKVLFLTTQGTKRYFAPSVTSKDTSHEWGRGHYMSTSIPTRGCGYSLMESHKHGCLLTYSLSLNPRSQPTRISCRSPNTPVLGCELGKAKQIFIAFVLWARPQTWAVWRRLREKMPRNRWTKRQGLHAWSKVRTHGCTHELFHPLKNEIKR